MVATCISETLLDFQWTTQHFCTQFYIPEENAPYDHSGENSYLTKIKFYINELLLIVIYGTVLNDAL
jgi:hypothetical protein